MISFDSLALNDSELKIFSNVVQQSKQFIILIYHHLESGGCLCTSLSSGEFGDL